MFKELKKITWTKPKELLSNFIIVVVFTTVMTSLIYLLDLFVIYLQNLILSML